MIDFFSTTDTLQKQSIYLFCSLYFANSGLNTHLNLLNTGEAWWTLVVLIILASIAKIVPVTLVTKLSSKRPWFYCLSIGVLMNTRGIVQLVVLNIGVELGVLSAKLFSIFVLMATILTFLTSPILSLLYRDSFDNKKMSIPTIAVDMRNMTGGEENADERRPSVATIANGNLHPEGLKPDSGKSSRKSSAGMPVHDTFVTFDNNVSYVDPDTSSEDLDDLPGSGRDLRMMYPRRSISMTRF